MTTIFFNKLSTKYKLDDVNNSNCQHDLIANNLNYLLYLAKSSNSYLFLTN